MKFAKELDRNAVPEWKTKYLDYKQGKKRLKAVARAIRTVERAPRKQDQRDSPQGNSARDAPVYSFLNRERGGSYDGTISKGDLRVPALRSKSDVATSTWSGGEDVEASAGSQHFGRQVDERSPLRQPIHQGGGDRPGMARYGSIIGSPPGDLTPSMESLSPQRTRTSMFELPEPALDPQRSKDGQARELEARDLDHSYTPANSSGQHLAPRPPWTQLAHTGNAYEVQKPKDKPVEPSASLQRILSKPHRVNSTPMDGRRPAFLRRVFTIAGGTPSATNSTRDDDVALEAYREVDFRKAEFFLYLDQQLDKIDTFYKAKEEEAIDRQKVLRHQLHLMRNKRLEELEAAEQQRKKRIMANGEMNRHTDEASDVNGHANGKRHRDRIVNAVGVGLDNALDKVDKIRNGHIGLTSKAMRDLGTPDDSFRMNPDNKDYTRKLETSVPYRSAKRQLKAAIIEYHRGLELLKRYAQLNHTAFRKITKKCDKTLPGGSGKDYLTTQVDRAAFVVSQTLPNLTDSTEDLYARYFERGNRKMAIEVLRDKGYRQLDYSFGAFRAGLFGGAGFALGVSGLYLGVKDSWSPTEYATIADYLLQIYAGYFLVVILAAMFCFECSVFKRNSVNYKFIFELNGRNSLDWRQLSEIPALFLFLLGLTMTLNFWWVGGEAMYRFWPLVLVSITVLLFLLPYPTLYHKTRRWFLYSSFRLLFSGWYPVEFRDLFLGDLTCSLTYVFGNFALFFCLYGHDWQDPPQCNSSHSIALGLLTTLPGLFRAAQCLNRFKETEKAFPHLANTGKYSCTIGMNIALMIFRFDKNMHRLAAFAAIATVNSVYCIVWDIKMDFSLFDVESKLLRKDLLFNHRWWYYAIMVIDPIIRFNWLLYVIFASDLQHGTIVSFCVALSEVIRRGLWSLFRVENEQIANNRALKAARELPVPFVEELPTHETAQPPGVEPSPLVQTLRRAGTTMAAAHSEDYVRRKSNWGAPAPTPATRSMSFPESDSDED
ncbi:Xenotropic and polytropic retrovirus receptor 1 [Vermiconidia calcicola]|uniref:Xenotropic and polytropic retrovirus receptor 1 n=1 Tax=Vermiconidia calcicola TaxID=1690605 RepID=A0ACC3N0I0_9PEZI|nr:Xenotropic and polytropic retrovirus receptor 1 [Vermiconidia calcicola]